MNMLNTAQIAQAQQLVDNMAKGTYTVKQIFGASWANVPKKNLYGKYFKDAVMNGKINNIVFNEIKSNNHNVYDIK